MTPESTTLKSAREAGYTQNSLSQRLVKTLQSAKTSTRQDYLGCPSSPQGKRVSSGHAYLEKSSRKFILSQRYCSPKIQPSAPNAHTLSLAFRSCSFSSSSSAFKRKPGSVFPLFGVRGVDRPDTFLGGVGATRGCTGFK
jgi:hypothetical protein